MTVSSWGCALRWGAQGPQDSLLGIKAGHLTGLQMPAGCVTLSMYSDSPVIASKL